IYDLLKKESEKQQEDDMIVYRGQTITKDELDRLKASCGQLISMNSFLSCSKNRISALRFSKQSAVIQDVQPILFKIETTCLSDTKPFADITDMSYFRRENEVLFMIGPIFKIENVLYKDDEQAWLIKLILHSEHGHEVENLIRHTTRKFDNASDLLVLGSLLTEMGKSEKAHVLYKSVLNRLSSVTPI
ncbi:unnamed protein product, partial [Didymodactylos carnosus]